MAARRDLFAVMEWSSDVGLWSVERITRSLQKAKTYKREILERARESQYRLEAKIIHPQNETVEAFCAYGNRVE